jgi:hypothetical protein
MLPTDLQEIFDIVAEHLMKQGMPAVRDDVPDWRKPSGASPCAYRSPDGLRCAVGVFIPDELYTPDLEGESSLHALAACGLISEDERRDYIFHYKSRLHLLVKLQLVHDLAALWPDRYTPPVASRGPEAVRAFWASKLREVAQDFGLQVPPCVS